MSFHIRTTTNTHTSYHRPNASVLHESKPENNSESIAFIFETKFFRFAESFHGKSFFALGTFAVIPPLCSINFHCVFRCKSVLLFSLSPSIPYVFYMLLDVIVTTTTANCCQKNNIILFFYLVVSATDLFFEPKEVSTHFLLPCILIRVFLFDVVDCNFCVPFF